MQIIDIILSLCIFPFLCILLSVILRYSAPAHNLYEQFTNKQPLHKSQRWKFTHSYSKVLYVKLSYIYVVSVLLILLFVLFSNPTDEQMLNVQAITMFVQMIVLFIPVIVAERTFDAYIRKDK